MAPRSSRSDKAGRVEVHGSHEFPLISTKRSLRHQVILEDQIIIVDECRNYTNFIDGLPLELTSGRKRGYAQRVNSRISLSSTEMAKRLFALLSPHLPHFPYPNSVKRTNGQPARPVHSFNSNIRLYKYTVGQYFGQHYDDSVSDTFTGAKSEWTLLVYITGVEDGVKGGETIFYKTQRGQPNTPITAPLRRGTALLHRHGHECLLHEGSPIIQGVKYVLRTDLMFMD